MKNVDERHTKTKRELRPGAVAVNSSSPSTALEELDHPTVETWKPQSGDFEEQKQMKLTTRKKGLRRDWI